MNDNIIYVKIDVISIFIHEKVIYQIEVLSFKEIYFWLKEITERKLKNNTFNYVGLDQENDFFKLKKHFFYTRLMK